MLLVLTPLLLVVRLLVREANAMEIGDVVKEIGPPTSIGGESAFVRGLSAEFCEVLIKEMTKLARINRLDVCFWFHT